MADKNQHEVNPVQVQKYLGGIDYPCSKQDLIKTAQKRGAEERILDLLKKLPNQKYNKPTDVTKAIGKIE